MTESQPTRRGASRSSLLACALLRAISLALPAWIWLIIALSASSIPSATASIISVAIPAALAIAYVAIVLATRGSGAPMIAGVSTTLGVLGAVALVPIVLPAEIDRMAGGHSMAAVVFGALAYVAAQFVIAGVARGLADTRQKVRSSAGFQLGVALPLACGVVLSSAARIPANRETEKAIANVQAREKTRGDLFALYACATAHCALAPRHEWPASLEALGARGDNCLSDAIRTAERGFRFEYAPRMAGANTVAGFTVRAIPTAIDPNATMLTMDEQAIIQEDWVNTAYPPLYRQTPPGLDMLVALRDCEDIYRHYRHGAPRDLRTLRAFADSTLNSVTPGGCWTFRNVRDRGAWADYGQARKLNEWAGTAYALTFHPAIPARWRTRPGRRNGA